MTLNSLYLQISPYFYPFLYLSFQKLKDKYTRKRYMSNISLKFLFQKHWAINIDRINWTSTRIIFFGEQFFFLYQSLWIIVQCTSERVVEILPFRASDILFSYLFSSKMKKDRKVRRYFHPAYLVGEVGYRIVRIDTRFARLAYGINIVTCGRLESRDSRLRTSATIRLFLTFFPDFYHVTEAYGRDPKRVYASCGITSTFPLFAGSRSSDKNKRSCRVASNLSHFFFFRYHVETAEIRVRWTDKMVCAQLTPNIFKEPKKFDLPSSYRHDWYLYVSAEHRPFRITRIRKNRFNICQRARWQC